jgi:tagatose-6-phosphate ketose/aldose isomerase
MPFLPMDSAPSLAPDLQALHDQDAATRRRLGYAHTLPEILQQPALWAATAADARLRGALAAALQPPLPNAIVLTGSGSSCYLGEALAPGLQAALGIQVAAVPAGTLLTHWRRTLPPGDVLLVSCARSGDSPESIAVVDALLALAPRCRHLFLTCNAQGALATKYREAANTAVALLDPCSNDRSLVMTGSFTSLFLAGRMLAAPREDDRCLQVAAQAGADARALFAGPAHALSRLADDGFDSALYLASGGRFGGAREAALKMLEMSGGRVQVMAETFLGLRHGPMSALREDTVLVAMLSRDARVRAYELDLLAELSAKRLARRRVLVGAGTTAAGTDGEVRIGCALDDDDATLIDVATGQLLALFRCLALGQRPDTPSQGVLTRVVPPFRIHPEHADAKRADTEHAATGHAAESAAAAGQAGMEPASA